MKGVYLVLALALVLASMPTLAATYEVKREQEGPFSFKIMGIEFNKGSSLRRESVLFNDPSCPVQLVKNAMAFNYADRRFTIGSTTNLTFGQPVMALEVRHILFDVLGRHMRNLANLEARDFAAEPASLSGTWNVFNDNDISELLTTVTYVSRARLADGTQWVFNSDNLTLALGTLHLEKKIDDDKPPTSGPK
ncbi:MAG: hypothetical protein WAM82_06625 [Thermoanaerobaculia bacterium]